MKLIAKTIHAKFNPLSCRWSVDLEEICFEVHYIKLKSFAKRKLRLGATIKEIIATEVELEWLKNILVIKKWKTINTIKSQELFNPDMPRNLAKSVTVR